MFGSKTGLEAFLGLCTQNAPRQRQFSQKSTGICVQGTPGVPGENLKIASLARCPLCSKMCVFGRLGGKTAGSKENEFSWVFLAVKLPGRLETR